MVRQLGMEAFPNPIPGNQSFGGTIVHRPVYKQIVISTPSICELEARSSSSSHRCIYSGLEHSSRELYANPPWGLIGRILSLVYTQGVQELVLVAPVWKAQAWYPLLLQMLVRIPILIPQSPDTIQSVCQNNLPDIIPQLTVWVISANNVKTATFLRQQQTLSSHHGKTSPIHHRTPLSVNGQAGVVNGIEIPFHVL